MLKPIIWSFVLVKSVVDCSREQAANGADFIMHKEQVLK